MEHLGEPEVFTWISKNLTLHEFIHEFHSIDLELEKVFLFCVSVDSGSHF